MPEFVMEGREHCARAESDFVLGFIEAMFFTESASGVTSEEWFLPDTIAEREAGRLGGELPEDVGYNDIHPESLKGIRDACERWQEKHGGLLSEAYATGYEDAQAGRDLWFTCNHHGVGFWDRKQLSLDTDSDGRTLGDSLTDAAHELGEVYVFFGNHAIYGDAPFVHVDL